MDPELRTLDIKEPQIIRHFPNDAGGFFWHHRVLLQKTGPGQWIGLSPDGDLERLDLTTVEHITLDRRGRFPLAQGPYIYAFDELTKAELEGHRRRAKVMCNLFNDASLEDVDNYEWLVADVSRSDFGVAFKDSDMENAMFLQDYALVEYEEEIVYAVRVGVSQKADWLKSKEKTKGDARLLGDFRDSQDRRYLEFKKAVDLMTSTEFSDWPLTGPRAALEFLRSVREGASDMTSYHLQWSQHSGVSQYTACVHEHRAICDYLRYLISVDQVDVTNLLGAEMMCRRLITIETAVSRNPAAPDFSGLELMMESSIGQSGEARTTKFTEWVGQQLKQKANVQKQARLYREEFSRGRGSGEASDAGDRARGRGRGRAKAKGRGGGGAPAAAS